MSKNKDEAKRQRILSSAARVFARKGYTACKISDIASEAQVADGTIYLYYRNKKDLLRAVFEHNVSELIPRMKRALKVGSEPVDHLRTFVQTHVEILNEHQELARGFQLDAQSPAVQEYLGILSTIIRQGQAAGQFRGDLQESVIKRVLVAVLSDVEPAASVQDKAEQIFQIMVGGLSKSLGKRAEVPDTGTEKRPSVSLQ